MKLQFVALLAATALMSVSMSPSFAAGVTAAATTGAAATVTTPSVKAPTVKAPTMKTAIAKPSTAKAATPDPKRFATEAAAQASCANGDSVVWANVKSKIFHLKNTATYGKGKNGTYMCQASATTEGFKPTKKPEKQTT